MQGDSALDSPRQLDEKARKALKLVEERLQDAFLYRVQEDGKIVLCVLPTSCQPTGLLWQEGPLLWIHPKISPAKSIEYYPAAVAALALCRIQQAVQSFGIAHVSVIVPYTANQVSTLCAPVDDWAILCCSSAGDLDNHYPQNPLMTFLRSTQ